jgi:PPOX class probable F420-dependent enzyme
VPLERYRELIEKRPIAHVAVVSPDGRPHTTPVWLELHEGKIRFSTLKGRVKHRYLLENPSIAVSFTDPDTPHVYVQVRGTATITDDPDKTLIHKLSHDYTGGPFRQEPPEYERIIVTVETEQVTGNAA